MNLSLKNHEIERLQTQVKGNMKSSFLLDEKSNIFSSNIIGLPHSTKNADDMNKLRRIVIRSEERR